MKERLNVRYTVYSTDLEGGWVQERGGGEHQILGGNVIYHVGLSNASIVAAAADPIGRRQPS